MSKDSLHDHMKRRIQHLTTRIEEAESKADTSDLREKVKLSATLKSLRERKEDLENRLTKIDSMPAGALSGLRAELLEDADHLEAALQRWFEKY